MHIVGGADGDRLNLLVGKGLVVIVTALPQWYFSTAAWARSG